jgi:hypothetical protein
MKPGSVQNIGCDLRTTKRARTHTGHWTSGITVVGRHELGETRLHLDARSGSGMRRMWPGRVPGWITGGASDDNPFSSGMVGHSITGESAG